MPERRRHVAPVQTNAIVDPPCESVLVCRRPSLSLYFAKLNKCSGRDDTARSPVVNDE